MGHEQAAVQLPPEPGEHMRPQDELYVPGIVLNSDKHGPRFPARELLGHRPTGLQ